MKYYLKFNFMNQLEKKLEKEMAKSNLIDEKAQKEDKISSWRWKRFGRVTKKN